MSYRFLLTMALISLVLSGVSGWIFFAEREQDPETLRIKAYQSELIVARQAAESGDEAAITEYAVKLINAPESLREDEKAMGLLRKAANRGFAKAQVEIGRLHMEGKIVDQNYHRAVEWFRLATRLSNNPEAHFLLGEAYFRGLGVPQDYGEAVPHYKAAAIGGNAVAQYIIGTMYEAGWGVRQDLVQSWLWLMQARPEADRIAAHEVGYDLPKVLKRVEKLMNHSQMEIAREKLAAIQG